MKTTFRNFLIFLGVALLLAIAWYFRSIVVYILVSGVLSIMGRPMVDLLCGIRIRKWSFPRSLSALITLIVIWALIILFLVIFVPLVTKQINYLSTIPSDKVVQIIDKPIKAIESIFAVFNKELAEQLSIKEYLGSKISEVLNINVIQNFMGSLVDILGNIAVAVFSITFITYFFLKDQRLFFETILIWVPDKYTENFARALNSVKNLLTRYFIGILIQSTCVMILIDIGMAITGIEFQQALVMGLIVGILNVIPYVGPWLGFFVVVIMGIASHINSGFVPLIYFMTIVISVTQLIDNLVFQPVIFSNSVRAHPLEIFIVILAAGFAAGIPGMIFGIPAYTVLRVFAREFFYNFKAVKKITSSLSPENMTARNPLIRDKTESSEKNPEK
ncbi:MAG: AI-2E family transporter [Bacteroidales bacterium]|nr:AI-2E family transporter [Bacteroidales bacterium]